jgi:hypothetical protein
MCKTPEEYKAWSQNLCHEDMLMTFRSYGDVSSRRQPEIMQSFASTSAIAYFWTCVSSLDEFRKVRRRVNRMSMGAALVSHSTLLGVDAEISAHRSKRHCNGLSVCT